MHRFSAALVLAGFALANRDARAATTAAQDPPGPSGSVFVDPLGLVMFGPRIGVEVGGSHLAGAISARWFDAALLSRALFLRSGDAFAFSWGAGLRGRYYAGENQGGAHGGVGFEILRTRIETKADLIAAISTYAIPYVEGGYRLASGRFFGDLSADVGYAARVGAHVENLPGGDKAATSEVEKKNSVYAALSLDLGLFF